MSSDDEISQSNPSKSLWRIYTTLSSPSNLINIYSELPKPISKSSGLQDLITETASFVNYSLFQASDYFSFEVNPNDTKDRVNLSDISLVSFTRRLGNYILEKIYLEGNFDKTLKEFISDVRAEEYEKVEEKQQASKKNTVKESIDNSVLSKKNTLKNDVSKGSQSIRDNEVSIKVNKSINKGSEEDEGNKSKLTNKSVRSKEADAEVNNRSRLTNKSGKGEQESGNTSKIFGKYEQEEGDEEESEEVVNRSNKKESETSKVTNKSGKKESEVSKITLKSGKKESEDLNSSSRSKILKKGSESQIVNKSIVKKDGGDSNNSSKVSLLKKGSGVSGSKDISGLKDKSRLSEAFIESDEDNEKSETFRLNISNSKVEKSQRDSDEEVEAKSPPNRSVNSKKSVSPNTSKQSSKLVKKIQEASDSDYSEKYESKKKQESESDRSRHSSKKSSQRSEKSNESEEPKNKIIRKRGSSSDEPVEKSNSKRDSSSDEPKNKSNKKRNSSSEEEAAPADIFGLGLSKLAINEVRNEKKQKRRNSDSSSSEKSSRNEKDALFESLHSKLLNVSKSTSKPIKRQWFTEIIKGREARIKEVFNTISGNKDAITVKDLSDVFDAVTSEVKVEIHDHHKESFKSIYETLHPIKTIQKPKAKTKLVIPRLKFEDFTELMNLWGEKYLAEQEKVVGEVLKTIKTFQDLNSQFSDILDLAPILTSLSKSLQKCLANHIENHKEELSVKDKFKKYLEDIFQFYAKVQRIQGTEDTFEAMEASNTNWNLGKFLKFCADFNIIQGKAEEKRALTKEHLTSIFKRTANNTRLMSESQFIESLDKIAEIIYSPDLDKLFSTNFAYLPVAEKRDMLYKLLGITEFNLYNRKKKAFGIAFSPEKLSRIPVSESSHQYKFKLNETSQKKLEIWKKTKVVRETPPLLKPIQEVKNTHSFIKKSVKALPVSGYALRLKAKKSQISSSKEEDKTEMYEDTNEYEEKVKRDEESSEPQPKIITIQALSNLNYKDLDDEYGIKDLISDESDEFFDKLYGIEPKLQGIMKMHDEKLARGQKVIEKNKYSYKNNN